jgi:hypothetical protein
MRKEEKYTLLMNTRVDNEGQFRTIVTHLPKDMFPVPMLFSSLESDDLRIRDGAWMLLERLSKKHFSSALLRVYCNRQDPHVQNAAHRLLMKHFPEQAVIEPLTEASMTLLTLFEIDL